MRRRARAIARPPHGSARGTLSSLGADLRLILALLTGRVATTTSAGPGEQARWLGDARRCVGADCFLLGLAVLTLAICLTGTGNGGRVLFVLAAACLIPGSALLTRLPVHDLFEAGSLAVALGLAMEAAGALVMVTVGWWHPFAWAVALLGAASVVFALDLRRVVLSIKGGE